MRIFVSAFVLVISLPFMLMGVVSASDAPTLLSAYFGLDNSFPDRTPGICVGGGGQDGMPVIFSQVINPDTLQKEDFTITTESGTVHTPFCVSLNPAVDDGELRTALLIGQMGDADTDQPVRVDIVGEILTDETTPRSFMGASVDVTPLSAGPTLVLAESLPLAQWHLDRSSGRMQGNGCPSANTLQAVRATWAGGVSSIDGEEVGEFEGSLYRVTLRQPDGTLTEVVPFALADLGDNDNNHLLCLDVRGEPVSVAFPAGHLLDPNEDTPNPDTSITVQGYTENESNRNVRYCEIVSTYRTGVRLKTEVWNTLGLNDCPADAWNTLDAEALQEELGAISVGLNGPRYWVLDEIGALGGVTSSGELATFGSINMELRAIIETRLRGDLVGEQFYTPNTVQRDTRYVFYGDELVYTLIDPDGAVYVMQSYAQIIDPALTIDGLETLGERLSLPEGWRYESVRLTSDFILLSGGAATIVQDDFLNTYQLARTLLPR